MTACAHTCLRRHVRRSPVSVSAEGTVCPCVAGARLDPPWHILSAGSWACHRWQAWVVFREVSTAPAQNVPLCLCELKGNVVTGAGVGMCGILEHFSLHSHSLLELGDSWKFSSPELCLTNEETEAQTGRKAAKLAITPTVCCVRYLLNPFEIDAVNPL